MVCWSGGSSNTSLFDTTNTMYHTGQVRLSRPHQDTSSYHVHAPYSNHRKANPNRNIWILRSPILSPAPENINETTANQQPLPSSLATFPKAEQLSHRQLDSLNRVCLFQIGGGRSAPQRPGMGVIECSYTESAGMGSVHSALSTLIPLYICFRAHSSTEVHCKGPSKCQELSELISGQHRHPEDHSQTSSLT